VGLTTYSLPATAYLQQNAELSGGNLVGRWQRVINDGSDLQLQAYYDRTNHYEPSFGEKRDTFDIDFLHHLTLPTRQNLLWGADQPKRFHPRHTNYCVQPACHGQTRQPVCAR
jgi:iron complex outermembrane receptor protein